ncbi:radical SAM protein [Hippea sp. KM1]|uniref:radical SAM protein n=1 Tax=Hippea sp. KM1 TaxID=944481 RepID=UPI00046D374C|nr:radical SAM protein [Hippea sp. KM1]
MNNTKPIYLKTYKEGKLDEKIEKAYEMLKSCRLCPRVCRVNRLAGKKGICNTAELPAVADYFPHFGEEDVLVGKNGSGTIFISCCNLLCIYCQNSSTSHLCEGRTVSIEEFSQMMLSLQRQGCHNINIVTPTHIVPQFLKALKLAIEDGLSIPIVYNTSGYELPETLNLLDGIIDIYMPDFKYWDSKTAEAYSSAKDYPQITKNAIKIMHKQVGDLVIEDGIAKRGLIIRHLVLPNRLAGTKEIVNFIAKEVSPNTYTNIMAQYRPLGLAYRFEEIARPITEEEYLEALLWAIEAGLRRLDNSCLDFLKRRGINP